ncbi:MAG: hypothetical protein RR101_08530 [Burkholderiaceae bacterium]
MARLITVLADMTSQRDRHALEIAVVDVMFHLIGARRVHLWRVIEHCTGKRVCLLAGIGDGPGVTMNDPGLDAADWPRLSDMPELAACHGRA